MAQINKPTDHFNTLLYTGNDTSQSLTGVGFQPDWTWIKCRSNNENHANYDSVRGATKHLINNLGNAEVTRSNGLTSFDSDGFSVGSENDVNDGTQTFASWNWKAGGTPSSNTDGTITSSVSANTTAGFSVGTYSGNSTSDATVGHGLSSAPEMVIVKTRDRTDNWQVYWNPGTERNGFWNITNAFNTPAATAQWGTNVPTSSVFYVGNDSSTNTGNDYVFYAFHSVKGYSKFGEFTGNGNADGTFVYTGFKPALVIIKKTAIEDWGILSNKISTSGKNVVDDFLYVNADNVESSALTPADFLSNGFKVRTSDNKFNGSGGTYTYMAFAEQPLVGTNDIPATAR